MSLWSSGVLTDLGTVERGRSRHRPRNDPSLYGGEYPFFQTGDVKAADLWLTTHSETYNEKGLAQSRLWPRGTLCITIAANIAEAAVLDVAGSFPDSVVGFTPYPDRSDVLFVKYLIDYIRDRFQAISRGTTQDNLSLKKLLSIRFAYPPLPIQRKISAILSAYDDLIENNNRRIKLLEEVAQRVYREWFVDLCYPGHENDPLVDSALGPIPQGWVVRPLGECVSQLHRTISPSQYPEEIFEHFSIPAFDDGQRATMEVGSMIKSNKFVIDGQCVLYSKLNPRIPRVWMATPHGESRAVSSTELLPLIPRADWNLTVIYCLLSNETFADRVIGMAGGTSTSHQRVRPNDLLTVPVVDPVSDLCELFEQRVGACLNLADQLRKSGGILRETRELLLPRLISGDVDVTDLDIAMAEEAA